MFRKQMREAESARDVTRGPQVVVVERDGKLTLRLSESCPEFVVEEAHYIDDAVKDAVGPTIIVLGPEASGEATLDRVEELRELAPTSELTFIVVVAKITTHLLRRALRAGISDVVTAASKTDFEMAIRRAVTRQTVQLLTTQHEQRGRLVAVFSPKGGVGTTMIAINIAAMHAAGGPPNVIVDADLPFGDVALSLGIEPTNTLADATGSDLDMTRLAGLFASAKGAELRALIAPSDPAQAEVITSHDVLRTLELCREVAPLVVVDTASAFDDITLGVLEAADEIVIVATPDLASVKNVKIALQTMRQLGLSDSRMHVVLNRVPARPGLRAADIEKALGIATISIPDDPAVGKAELHGVPVVVEAPKAAVSRALIRLTEQLVQSELAHTNA